MYERGLNYAQAPNHLPLRLRKVEPTSTEYLFSPKHMPLEKKIDSHSSRPHACMRERSTTLKLHIASLLDLQKQSPPPPNPLPQITSLDSNNVKYILAQTEIQKNYREQKSDSYFKPEHGDYQTR
jgi:hypothetical protein